MKPRLLPLPAEEIAKLTDIWDVLGGDFHELPNSIPTLARRPDILKPLMSLWVAVMNEGEVAKPLKWMAGYMASRAYGCMYCSAHTATGAAGAGIEAEKIAEIWEFDTSDKFDDTERAVLRFAMSAGQMPNGVTDEIFDDLRKYFSESQIVELLSVVSMYGFWNRWNDTIGTELELTPLEFSTENLSASGWHAPGQDDKS